MQWKKNTLFEIVIDGKTVNAIVLKATYHLQENLYDNVIAHYLCYGQNRLFLLTKISRKVVDYIEDYAEPDGYSYVEKEIEIDEPSIEIICDYVIIPDLDKIIKL